MVVMSMLEVDIPYSWYAFPSVLRLVVGASGEKHAAAVDMTLILGVLLGRKLPADARAAFSRRGGKTGSGLDQEPELLVPVAETL